jgi:integrase
MMIYTLGYQGWTVEQVGRVAQELSALVVDVRLVPSSRVPGFQAGGLNRALEGRYVWLRGFGNRNYKGGPLEFEDFEGAAAALREKLAGGGPANVILMCACRDLKSCHRKEVAERLSKEWGDMVAHLEAPGGPAGDEPKKRRSVVQGELFRVGLITRPERARPFQFRIVNRLTGAVERRAIHDITECTRRSKRDALGRAAALEADLNAGRAMKVSAMTWETFKEDYLADLAARSRHRTLQESRSILNLLHEHRKPETLAEITSSDIERFRASRPGASRATQNKYLRTLSAAFNWAKDKGFITANPVATIRRAKVDRKPPRVIADASDRDRLMARLGEQGAEWEAAAQLLLATGLRIGEVAHLTWRSIDLKNRWLQVQPEPDGGASLVAKWSRTWAPKNHHCGLLALDADLVGTLTDRKARARLDLLTPKGESRGFTVVEADSLLATDTTQRESLRVFGRANPDGWAKLFRAEFKKACESVGLPAIRPHDLRRTFATMLARRGLDPLALKTVMRHSRIQTTEQFYINIDGEAAAIRARNMLRDDGNPAICATTMPEGKDTDEGQGA